jgi:hypothetical protein
MKPNIKEIRKNKLQITILKNNLTLKDKNKNKNKNIEGLD